MLIEFSVTNFRSFKEKQALSLVADSSRERSETHCIVSNTKGMPTVLKTAVIHGANASGKSNLILALRTMQHLVLNDSQRESATDLKPFMLDASTREGPSEFEVIFCQKKVRYQYGFIRDRERVHHEWLIAYPQGRPQRWFERILNDDGSDEQTYSFHFSDKFLGQKAVYRVTTRPDALLLSTAVQLNNKMLAPVFEWFEHRLRFVDHTKALLPNFSIELCKSVASKTRVLKLLNNADFSVRNITSRERKIEVPGKVPPEVMEELAYPYGKEAMLEHGQGDISFNIPLEEDSAGTQKLFALAGPLVDVFDKDLVLVIDELNNSFHTALLRHIISMFHQKQGGAQLVFTSHDICLLDLTLFRRDQIWFIEKTEALDSQLYPLTDFHPRKTEAVGKGYLEGRYGALPFLVEADHV